MNGSVQLDGAGENDWGVLALKPCFIRNSGIEEGC